ncbi:MAG: hypothetical protein WCF40_00395 [Desulfobacterales bacterium]|jgi:hypothetical protein
MSLLYSSLFIALAALLFGITLIGARNPSPPPWAKDFLVANVYVPAIAGMGLFGAFGIIKFILDLSSKKIDIMDPLGAAVVLIAAVICLKLLRIKKRLAAYEAQETNAEVLKLYVFKSAEHTEEPIPPAKPTTPRLAA